MGSNRTESIDSTYGTVLVSEGPIWEDPVLLSDDPSSLFLLFLIFLHAP